MTPPPESAAAPTPEVQSRDELIRDPARDIAVSLFTTLGIVAAIGLVLGYPFWTQKEASSVILGLLVVGNLAGRWLALRGRHVAAMHGFATLTMLMAVPLMLLSVHMTAPTLIVVTILPAYAAVCGRRPAMALGSVYIAASIVMHVAERYGIHIPKLFPTPHAAEVATSAIAIAGILGPLAKIFDRLRDSARSLLRENEQRRLAEARLNRAIRALATTSSCNKLLVRAETEEQLMQGICKLAVESGGYRMAWVGYSEIDTERRVRPMASYGHEDGYLDQARISWADNERGRGPTGTAIREARTVVAKDIRNDPRFQPWRDAALARGYESAIALPLLTENKRCHGALTLYATEADAFDATEVALLEELAGDLAFGIAMMWVRAARDAAEQTSRYNEALAKAIVDQAPDAIELADPTTLRFLEVNDASCRLLGYSREERLAQTVSDIQAEMTPQQLASMTADIVNKGYASFETRHRRKDGRLIDAMVSVRTLQLQERDYLLAIWRDITVERLAQAELRKLSLVVEQSPNPVIITDLDTRIEYVNDAFTRLSGYSREQAMGQTPRMLKSGLTPDATYAGHVADPARGQGLAWRVHQPDGRRRDTNRVRRNRTTEKFRWPGQPLCCRQGRRHGAQGPGGAAAQALDGGGTEPREYRHHRCRGAHRVRQRCLPAYHRLYPRRTPGAESAHPAIGQDRIAHLRRDVGHADPGQGVAGRAGQSTQGRQRVCRIRAHRTNTPGRWPDHALRRDQGGHFRQEGDEPRA
jgi:PAS domain S-box-containing protein